MRVVILGYSSMKFLSIEVGSISRGRSGSSRSERQHKAPSVSWGSTQLVRARVCERQTDELKSIARIRELHNRRISPPSLRWGLYAAARIRELRKPMQGEAGDEALYRLSGEKV